MIITAEEFSENYSWTCCPEKSQVLEAMIEFAKLHVTKALETASENGEVEEHYSNPYDQESLIHIVNKDSILNAYPLDNIK